MTGRKLAAALLAAFISTLALHAQRTGEEYRTRYALLNGKFGPSGVGIETLVAGWEKDWPEDVDMLCAKFNYYFSKGQNTQVVVKDAERFLGQRPVLTLKDSTGKDVNYFQETMYDDSLFAIASQALQKAVRVRQDALDLRFMRITSLMAYEKDSPDMATFELRSLIDCFHTAGLEWKFKDEPVDEDFFRAAIQEYCVNFYMIYSATSMEAFRSVSEKMLSYWPDNEVFLDNLGTYQLVWKRNNKLAAKYYSKVLKVCPSDYIAAKNMVTLYRSEKNLKMEKKYLPRLIANSSDEAEKQAAGARLEQLSQKKK